MSVEDAFAYMAEFSHTSEWDPNCEVSEKTTPGEVGKGTRFHLEFSAGGQTVELDYEVTEFDAPRRFVLEGSNESGLHSTDVIEVEPAGSGAKVVYNANIEYPEGGKQLLNPLLSIGIKRAGSQAKSGLEEKLNP